MEKKNGPVKVAETKRPESDKPSKTSSGQLKESANNSVPVEKTISIEDFASKITPDQRALAKDAGFPIGDIIDYLKQEEREKEEIKAALNVIVTEMPKEIVSRIQKVTAEAQAKQRAAMQVQQQKRVEAAKTLGINPQMVLNPQAQRGFSGSTLGQQGGGLGQLLQVLSMFGGGGGSDELNKLAMAALTSNINMATSITQAVVSKITGKATTEVAKAVTEE